MSWQHTLDADTLREIFERDIAPTLSAGGALALRPSVIFVGAQPGAGKSRSIADVQADNPDAVAVVGDDFRAFHPDYWDLMSSDPLAMPDVTAQAAGAWVGMSAQHLRNERRSVILETTMRQHAVVEATALAFRDAGYRVEVRALAVPGAISLLGTVSRFLGSGNDRNRWTPSAAHQAAYKAMPDTIEQLVANRSIDRITVTTRAQHVLYDRAVTAESAETVAVEARRAVDAGRHTSGMTAPDGDHWVREYLTAATTLARLPQVSDDMRRTMDLLGRDAPSIVRASYDPSAQPRILAAVRGATSHFASTRDVDARMDTGPITGSHGAAGTGPSLR